MDRGIQGSASAAEIPRDRANDALPPELSWEDCVRLCMTSLGLTRAESVAALTLVLEQTPKLATARIGCAYGTFRAHTRAILLKLSVASSIGIVVRVLSVLWHR